MGARSAERWSGGGSAGRGIPRRNRSLGWRMMRLRKDVTRGESSSCALPPVVSPHEIRFRTLIFWVYEPMENLRPRLDHRVDKMVDVSLS
jgi:tRNA dimethylallyltransferase